MGRGLDGKVVFITGGGGGIGSASASAFAAEGARVIVADLDEERGRDAAARVVDAGGEAHFLSLDVTRSESVREAFEEARRRYGPVDVLLNIAGYSMEADRGVGNLPEEVWMHTFAVVLHGSFLCAKQAIPDMLQQGGGCIVNTSSVVGLTGSKGQNAYATAKTAVIGLTRNLALQYAHRGIRCNAICPGMTLTPRLRRRMEDYPASAAQFKARQPLGFCEPEEIAAAALYLASDDARRMTGQTLVLDGGYTLGTG